MSHEAVDELSGATTPAVVPARPTLLESGFPFPEVSRLALADRHSKDRVYGAHKWWARRPPGVIRALLLAAALPAGTSAPRFWELYASDQPHLEGHHVGDPFMGGATTIVEAARLGADVTGIDVDPLAVRIARQELSGVDLKAFNRAGDALLAHLDEEVGELFGYSSADHRPLHFFFLREATCSRCDESALVYRSLIIARDDARAGGVVRDCDHVVFCPDCRGVHHLTVGEHLACCGRTWPLNHGTFGRGRFHCPTCAATATHESLRSALLPRVLIAVEETRPGHRAIRAPLPEEDGVEAAASWWRDRGKDLQLPVARLGSGETGRAKRYGFERVRDLFSGRQQALFAAAFDYVEREDLADEVRDSLKIAVSNALAASNQLCGYAQDYGRIAPLFTGVRAYSMPVLSVELNPLHRSAGRGTLPATLRRVAQSATPRVTRHTLDHATAEIRPHDFVARRDGSSHVACRSADRGLPEHLGRVTIALSDPPYFDYISYSDLSLFYRAWHRGDGRTDALRGAPIYPVGENAAETFRARLARAFGKLRHSLAASAVFCFTFHATDPQAWEALGDALVDAQFTVTSAFPVWADGRAASHNHAGNCEWDIVFVCRPAASADDAHADLPDSPTPWIEAVEGFRKVSAADRASMAEGLACARRAARPS